LSRADSSSESHGFLRRLVRLGLALFYPKIRLLHPEVLPEAGATLLAVGHPPDFRAALILTTALEAPVRCLMPRRLLQSGLRRLLADRLGMIAYQAEDFEAALQSCREALGRGETVAVFAEPQEATASEAGRLGRTAAALALEAVARHPGGLKVVPVHLFSPVPQPAEYLIYVDDPIDCRRFSGGDGGASPEAARALAARIESVCRENAFRLEPRSLGEFLSDLEEVLRSDLEETWAGRSNWKQTVEGFELSRFVAEWTTETNYLDPGRLVALRRAVDEYREGRRLWSLRQFDVEAGGRWLRSRWGWVCIWAETLAGLPVALYGLVNHLFAWALLSKLDLLKKRSETSRTDWLWRALIVLGCYASQALLCASLWDRAAAGYYLPSLPLAGAYLWRYRWLLRQRTRRAFEALRSPAQAAALRRRRRALVEQLNRSLELHADALGVAH